MTLLVDQGVRIISGKGRMAGPHRVIVETVDGPMERA